MDPDPDPVDPKNIRIRIRNNGSCLEPSAKDLKQIVCYCNTNVNGSVADPDPGSGAFLTPGSGMGRTSASGSGINNPDHA
jgi:hypothetical protein